jgi:hypothetical protein
MVMMYIIKKKITGKKNAVKTRGGDTKGYTNGARGVEHWNVFFV